MLIKPNILDPVLQFVECNNSIRFIDIGCGSGTNTNFWGSSSSLKNLSSKIDVVGVEPSDKSREILSGFDINSFASINEIKKGEKFNIIRLNWSLEHVHKPSLYFKFISDHLTSNGIAVVCVPNNNGLIYKIDKNCLELPVHLYHFDKNSLLKYASNSNLRLVSFETFSYPSMYIFASQVGLIKTEFSFSKMNLLEAQNFLKMHSSIDNVGLGNDIVAVFMKGNY